MAELQLPGRRIAGSGSAHVTTSAFHRVVGATASLSDYRVRGRRRSGLGRCDDLLSSSGRHARRRLEDGRGCAAVSALACDGSRHNDDWLKRAKARQATARVSSCSRTRNEAMRLRSSRRAARRDHRIGMQGADGCCVVQHAAGWPRVGASSGEVGYRAEHFPARGAFWRRRRFGRTSRNIGNPRIDDPETQPCSGDVYHQARALEAVGIHVVSCEEDEHQALGARLRQSRQDRVAMTTGV